MIDLGQAAVMGLVQGLTEFLPISSAGHLILIPAILGWSGPITGLEFTVALHLGTLLALMAVFWKDWIELLGAAASSLGRRSLDPQSRLAWLIVLATIPAAVAGGFFEKVVESLFRSPAMVASTLIAFALVLGAADRWSRKVSDEHVLRAPGALAVGCAQALALIPGVSRSGITIATGLTLGLTRQAAARFSFLLSAPIIAGAGVKEAYDMFKTGSVPSDLLPYGVGILVSGLAGFVSIRWLLAYLGRGSLMPFVAYRVMVGLAVLAMVAIGRL